MVRNRPATVSLATTLVALITIQPVALATGSSDLDAWMEILPFSSWQSRVLTLSSDGPGAVKRAEQGAAVVCIGGSGMAITCEEQFLHSGEPIEPPDAEPGVMVVGRVLVNGEPASGVQVALTLAGLTARRPLLLPLGFEDGKVKRAVVSDAKGRFSTPPLAAASYRLELKPTGGKLELLDPIAVPTPEDLRDETTDQDPSAEPTLPPTLDVGDLEVAPGLAIEFLVIDESGAPLPGAAVAANQSKATGGTAMFETHVDKQGRAVLRGFEAGRIQTTCSMPGFSLQITKFEALPTWVECVLQPQATLSGDVLSDDEGVAGVTVSLVTSDRYGRNRSSTTDSEGRFLFPGIDAGEYRLVFAAPGFEVVEREGTLVPGEEGSEVVNLEPAPPRWGRVIDAASGEPVAGARVSTVDPAGAVSGISDEEGELFFDAPSDRHLILEVSARGYPRRHAELTPEDGTEDEPWQVELTKGGRIAVTVWSSKTDGPCVGCDLWISSDPAASGPDVPGLRTGQDGRAVTADLAQGRYRINLPEISSFGSMVQVRGGHNVKTAEVEAGTVTEVVFGEPRQTVEVRFRPLPAPGWQLRSTGREAKNLYDPQPDGSFKVRRRPGEALALRLVSRGVGVDQGILAPESEDFVALDLAKTSVTGQLDAELEIDPAAPGLKIRSLFHGGSTAWVMPGPNGRFEIPFLPPGAYRIVAGERALATFQLAEGQALELGKVPD